MRHRAEPFGAWVMLDRPRALVALDRAAATGLGIEGGAAWTAAPARAPVPLEAHVAVTARCGVGCRGCYLDAQPTGAQPSFDELTARLDALARAGVFVVAFGGGEPLARADLGALADYARGLGLSPVVTTSGFGLGARRAHELRAFDQVNVSYDGAGEGYLAVRGVDGASVAERAMGELGSAGVRFGINLVMTRANFARVEATVGRAASLGAFEVQLLRVKPAGRATASVYESMRLTRDQAEGVYALVERLVRAGRVSVRVDCSMLPFFSLAVADPEPLERYGIFGCEAARHLAAIRVDGQVAPCSFAPASAVRVNDVGAPAWADDPVLEAHRSFSHEPPPPCASCPIARVCRGGCRVVAAHAGDPAGPDPECPRVAAHRAGMPR